MPLVTVMLPVYNGEEYIGEAIESVLRQTYRDFEFIIVDNASTDRTNEIICGYLDDPRIRLVRNDTTIPLLKNFLKAAALASPESRWLKYIGVDDRFYPECLAEMVRVAALSGDIGIVSAYCYDGNKLLEGTIPGEQEVMPGPAVLREMLLDPEAREAILSPCTLMILKEAFHRAGGFRADLYHADTELFYRILNDFDLGFIHKPLTISGRRPRSAMSYCNLHGTLQSEGYLILYHNLRQYTRVQLTTREVEKIKYRLVVDSTGFLIAKLAHGQLKIALAHLRQVPLRTCYYIPPALGYYLVLFFRKLFKREPFKVLSRQPGIENEQNIVEASPGDQHDA